MIVAGIGFRAAATMADLHQALTLAGPPPDALASVAEKATAPVLRDLAQRLDLPLIALPPEALAAEQTPTSSPRVQARFGTGSLAEAAALAGARHGQPGATARLLAPRTQSANGMATAALAERIPQ